MNKRERLYREAISKWGETSQALMAMSECGELIAALGRHFVQSRKDDDAVIDEIADVTIMIEQLTMMFGRSRVNSRIAEKVKRLQDILDGTAEHPHV